MIGVAGLAKSETRANEELQRVVPTTGSPHSYAKVVSKLADHFCSQHHISAYISFGHISAYISFGHISFA